MKKKVVLAVAFVLLVLSSIMLSSNSADAKTYKRKIQDNITFLKDVKMTPTDELQFKWNKKRKYTFEIGNPSVAKIDNKGHVTINAIGNCLITIYDENNNRHECPIKVQPTIFKAEDLTVKVGETFRAKLDIGGAPTIENFEQTCPITQPKLFGDEIVHINYEDGLPLGTMTALIPGEATLTIHWQNLASSFHVTVVE